MMDSYVNALSTEPKNSISSPLKKGDYPWLNAIEFLDEDRIQKYQSLIIATQSVIFYKGSMLVQLW